MPVEYEIFQGWIQKFQVEIASGQEIRVPLQDLDTMGKISVRGIISEDPATLQGPCPLRVVNDLGEKRGALFVSVIEELDDMDSAAIES